MNQRPRNTPPSQSSSGRRSSTSPTRRTSIAPRTGGPSGRRSSTSSRTNGHSSRRPSSSQRSHGSSNRRNISSTHRAPSSRTQSSSVVSTVLSALAEIGRIILTLLFAFLRLIVSAVLALAQGFMRLSGIGKLVVIGIICILLIVFAFVSNCSGSADTDAAQSFSEVVENNDANSDSQSLTVQDAHISDSLDPDVSKALSDALASNFSSDLVVICNEADSFDIDGPEVQRKLLLLAAADVQARPNLVDFPTAYPQKTGQPYDQDVEAGTVPNLYQWDKRWGNTTYSSAPFSATGCAPTAFSMVYMALTGKSDLTPYDMGVRAINDGFETQFNGTANGYFESESAALGINCSQLSVDSYAVTAALSQGNLVICNAGNGDFSSYGGHFFVITKVNDDGTWSINDPYSSVNSSRNWDPAQITDQTKAFWTFSMA